MNFIKTVARNYVKSSMLAYKGTGNMENKQQDFEKILHKTEKIFEAEKMLHAGVPLSIIARTLKLKISDILHLQ